MRNRLTPYRTNLYGFSRSGVAIIVTQAERRRQIETAAYAVLEAVGYGPASMLVIAKAAKSSNETLYKWYANKQGLFCALVEANAQQSRHLLETALLSENDAVETLRKLGPILLTMVTGERAIALNRAAASDVKDTATLGPAIARAGRDTIAPLLGAVISRAIAAGALISANPVEAGEVYISLLIGDLQIRRVIGVLPVLSPEAVAQRAARAHSQFIRLYGTPIKDKTA
ncbi:MAG: TetR/AcrR family transcriptional regulator C-terminal domain-containing protein [Alphaproteobacteria bacterium]|nr:TetR/AcrR family transcriptional regulator C-terminal domain-containing protein [Alphaproteobacteria bacterium]